MDEADVLCDRIAILADGRLRAVGTQQRLKHRFGSGYKLVLHLAAPAGEPAALEAAAARANAYVTAQLAPGAALLSRVGSTLSYVLPRVGTDVAGIFGALDAAKGRHGISEFGISQASLEEVFVKVVRAAGGDHAGDAVVVNPAFRAAQGGRGED
jgi:ABC-type multidrug transport system ATPase subunit